MLLIILAITLMVLDKRVAGISQIRNALALPLTPLQYAVSWPLQVIDNLYNMTSSHDALMKENLNLKSEALLLRAQVQRLLAIESENNQLKALMRSSTKVQGKVLMAQILAVDADPFVNQIVLDKGSRDGVFVGQPVLDANGVMGQVIQISYLTSRVLLITDVHSGVPVENTRNGIRSIAIGDHNFSGKLKLINVTQTADVRVGDTLVTSGMGEHFPEGYLIGSIASIFRDPGLQFATIIIEPSAHLDRSRQVLLVWPSKSPTDNKQVDKPI